MAGFDDGFLGVPERPGKPRSSGLTHVIDKGLNLREIEGLFDTAGAFVDIVKLGWGTGYVDEQSREEDRALPAFRDAGRLRRHALRGRLRARQDRRVQGLAERASLLACRDLRRHDRDPARAQARAHRRLRARLHRALGGGLEGRRGEHRAVPLGAVDAGGARRGRLEGDRRGPRGRHGRHLPAERRAPHRPGRRDRALRSLRSPDLGGAEPRRARPGSSGTSARTSTSATSRPTR